MVLLDYDEFNIYTNVDDLEIFVENLLTQGIELKEEVYNKCLEHFGGDFKDVIDIFFEYED